jgi:peptidoglycan/xylan/chitin deacetylase (PgdA/CDA1 family)
MPVSFDDPQGRRIARARERRRRLRRRRLGAIGGLAGALVLALAAVVLASSGGGSPRTGAGSRGLATSASGNGAHLRGTASGKSSSGNATPGNAARGNSSSGSTATNPVTGPPGTTAVPVLMYHVIAPPPSGAPYPGLYVPPAEFAAQMQALKAAGWHAVTLDQVRAYWTRGASLGPGKPIVLSFDNGYHSQYSAALPVLRQLGWVGDENVQLTGLPPSQGGLTDGEVRALITAGWELDTQGISHADLIRLDASELHYQVVTARQILRRRYGVPVNWFCYPSGHYDATVIDEVKAAGYVGSTTVVPGWAAPGQDPFRLPRLRVLGGTSPQALLAQIADARGGTPPESYGSA